MISYEKAKAIQDANGFAYFTDNIGRVVCGRIVNIQCVNEPPNTKVANLVHMDHIKLSPNSDIIEWSAKKQLVDLYETAEAAAEGHIQLQKRILGARIKTHEDLFQFMLSHDCKSDPVAHAVALEKHELFLHKI